MLVVAAKVVHHLVKLHREGHKILLLGHSLGGGVAALMGCLVKEVSPTSALDYRDNAKIKHEHTHQMCFHGMTFAESLTRPFLNTHSLSLRREMHGAHHASRITRGSWLVVGA